MKNIFNKIFKSVFVPMVIAIICGFICGKFVYKTYKDDLYGELRSSKLYLIQNGEYLTYDDMRIDNNSNNYVYYKDNDGYKTVIGITSNEENIDKIKSLYNEDVMILEYYVSNDKIDSKQEEYDDILYNTNDIYEVKEIVDNILNLYRSDDSIKLVSIG